MAPSDVHVQTAGVRKESEMARNPGGPGNPLTGKRQQCRETVGRQTLHGQRQCFGNGAEPLAEEWTGTEIAVDAVPRGDP
jgi:hypothetical protein